MKVRFLAALIILAIPLSAVAQPLADRVPADAVLYVGWQGSQSMGAAYENSHLKAVLADSNLPQVFSETVPALIRRIAQEDAEAAQVLQLVSAIGAPLWKHPSAFYFAGVDFAAQPNPQPKAALLCRAGDQADAMVKLFDQVLTSVGPLPFTVRTYRKDDLAVLSIGFADESAVVAPGASAMAANPRFRQAIGQVHTEPVAMAYADAAAIMKLIDQVLQFDNDPGTLAQWQRVRDALGLSALQQLAWTGAFDGPDWSTRAFIGAPAPRAGLLTLLDHKPLSQEMLRSIPKNTTWMTIGRLDLARFAAELRVIAGKIDPGAQQAFDMAMGAGQMALAMNVQKDLLEPLGSEWAMYSDPGTGGGLTGLTVINRLARPADAQRALSRFELFIDNTANGLLARQKMRITFTQTTVAGANIRYAVLPLVSPAWTIKNGNLYLALYPQTLAAMAQQPPAAGGSILDNPDFQALRKRLGADNAASMSFADLPRTVDQSYPFLLMGAQLATGMADMFGVKTPPMVIPPLNKLRKHLSPAASFCWSDDSGWHMRGVSPFPGSVLLSSEGAMLTGAVPLLGVAMPAMTVRAHAAPAPGELRQVPEVHLGQ